MAITLPAFVHRNPRYTILLIFVLVCSSFLLLPHPDSSSLSSTFSSSSASAYVNAVTNKFRPQGQSLEQWVADEEMHYNEFLEKRHAFIQKYGPEPAQVDP